MIIYLGLSLSKPLTEIPHPSSIELKIDGKEYLCTWDESDHCFLDESHSKTDHRLKGVSVWEGGDTEEVYGNGLLKPNSNIEFLDINFDEMDTDVDNDFEIEVTYLCVVDDDVKITVVEKKSFSFAELLRKLDSGMTFKDVMEEIGNTEVECVDNEVYEDDDLYELLASIGVEIRAFGINYALFVSEDGKIYNIPYETRRNRHGDDLPSETILFFEVWRIHENAVNEKSCDTCGRFNYEKHGCGKYIDNCMNMEKGEAYYNWIPMCKN